MRSLGDIQEVGGHQALPHGLATLSCRYYVLPDTHAFFPEYPTHEIPSIT